MKKGKHANQKNKNVLGKLERAVNKKANPHFNKKSQAENFDKDIIKEKENKGKLKSKIETQDAIEDFGNLAQLANKKYEVIPEQVALQTVNTINIVPINQSNNILITNTLKNADLSINNQEIQFLSIPKRPKWNKTIKKEDYQKMEKESFLAWRKNLAEEEMKNINMTITPFEKNFEVWKQLWIVVDKCQILFQIVDGRNPLYFHCPDLDSYIKQVDPNKESVLIVNKADLMSEEIRKNWADYFKTNNMKYIFFSALDELNKFENNENETEIKEDEKKDKEEYKIYNRIDLLKYIKNETSKLKIENSNNQNKKNPNTKLIGFIGYPNVGKSSIINVLMKTKKVGVAMMPGKTKHYQTLFLPQEQSLSIEEKEICLMDCPGLVFPSFTSSKADMLVNGIFPIDKLTDYHSPIHLIIKRIPKKILSKLYYNLDLPDIYSAKQFLQILANKRGFFTGNGLPDEAKAAKMVLKDYVSGKLLYCYLRPDYNEEKFGFISPYGNIELSNDDIENHKMIENIPANFDDNYEKLYMENEQILENKKVKGDDVDELFFNNQFIKENAKIENDNKPISKEMRRQLKFAVKRGDVDYDDVEDIVTVKQYNDLMEEIAKNKGKEKIGKNIIKTQAINF